MPFDNNSEFGPWTHNGVPDISPSRLKTFKDCPQKYYVEELLKMAGIKEILHQMKNTCGVDNIEFF